MQHPAEWIEMQELQDMHAAATPVIKSQLQLYGEFIGDAFVSIAPTLPASAIVLNRCLGLGLSTVASKENILSIIDAYRHRDVPRFFLQLHPAAQSASIRQWFVEANLSQARSWQKFQRGTEPVVRPANNTLEIKVIDHRHGGDFADIACNAFDLGDAAKPWVAALPGREHWHIFMSFVDGDPAGTGGLFIKDELAWLDFGATAPQFRQQGSQSALLAARIGYALDHGCRSLFTCTGEAVSGDPQHSYKNIVKNGFAETYLRENYAPN